MTSPVSCVNLAKQRFKGTYSCSEAVASAFATQFGLPEETLRRVACGFGGGMGGLGRTCGAVTGAIMVIGMALAPEDPADKTARAGVKEAVKQFMHDFESRHGSSHCKELLGYDLSSHDGYAMARSQGVFKTLCPHLVSSAAELVRGLIDKEPQKECS